MPNPKLHHEPLKATFNGISRECDGVSVHQFRGIKYASIPGRFGRGVPVEGFGKVDVDVDATSYGPRCPQNEVDVRHLLRIPGDFKMPVESEDEFECLNLDVTCPALGIGDGDGGLPVVIWIHGGSQIVTFCSAASKICDPTRIVADSIKVGKPIIFVSINYRLNIFAFGDGKERNLAIKDQRLGIEWVRKYISGFGGDPDNITLAGESAGAVYVHAHLITGPPVKRAVLASGTLYLSSPLPVERGDGLVKTLEAKVRELGQSSLRESPAPVLLQALRECNVNTMWIQEDAEFDDWEKKLEQVDEVMIGDTEYESIIWRNGIQLFPPETITAIFNNANPQWAPKLCSLYQIHPDRPTPTKLGALDFINDTRFTLPVELVSEKLQKANKRVYKYVLDQPNPWQASSRAHHAVDLLFLFGGVDLSFNPAAERVGQEMRGRWIRFVNGDVPWRSGSGGERFAYGPFGECKEISSKEFACRRRVRHLGVLRDVGVEGYMSILGRLTAGKISLLN